MGTLQHSRALPCPWKCLAQCSPCACWHIAAPTRCHRGPDAQQHKKGLMAQGHSRASPSVTNVTDVSPFLTGDKMPFKNKPAGLPWPCLQCEHRQAPHIPPHPVADPELGEAQLENLRAADQERGQPWCTWTAEMLCTQRGGSWPWGVAAWQSWHITDFWLQIPTLFGSLGKKKPFFSRAIAQVAGGDGLDPIPRKPKPLTLRASITQDHFPQTSPNSCFPVWFGRKKG